MSIAYPELAAIRLGYGLSPLMPPPADAAAVLASVKVTAARPPEMTTAEAQAQQVATLQARHRAKEGEAQKQAFDLVKRDVYGRTAASYQARLAHAAGAPVGFGERLAQFWADHFTVRTTTLPQRWLSPAFIEEAIRPHIGGRFADMLKAAVTHPAMVLYLNQNQSVGPDSPAAKARRKGGMPGLNENLARELMELHTLGVGATYSQEDVRSLANLLTGLTYDAREDVRFVARRAEPGADTVLGKSYGGRKPRIEDIHAVLDDLAVHPATARHLATKLAMHFSSDEPDPGMVADLTNAYARSDGDLMAVYAVLVAHPALAAQFRQKVRQPFDFIAAALRALGLSADAAMAINQKQARRWLRDPLEVMGQPLDAVPGPDGWPEEAGAWIRPQLLAERIDWAMTAPSRLVDPLPDPRRFVQTALGSTASEGVVWAVPKAESVREGVGIVLASADFNRR